MFLPLFFFFFAAFSFTCPLCTCDPRSHDPMSLVASPLPCLSCVSPHAPPPNHSIDQSNHTTCQFPALPVSEDVCAPCYGRLNAHPQIGGGELLLRPTWKKELSFKMGIHWVRMSSRKDWMRWGNVKARLEPQTRHYFPLYISIMFLWFV